MGRQRSVRNTRGGWPFSSCLDAADVRWWCVEDALCGPSTPRAVYRTGSGFTEYLAGVTVTIVALVAVVLVAAVVDYGDPYEGTKGRRGRLVEQQVSYLFPVGT